MPTLIIKHVKIMCFSLHLLRTQLSSNYIKIKLEQDKGIYEYRVDYNPPIDAKSVRFMLLNGYRDMFPVKTFDGTLLYIPQKLPQNVIVYFFSKTIWLIIIINFI